MVKKLTEENKILREAFLSNVKKEKVKEKEEDKTEEETKSIKSNSFDSAEDTLEEEEGKKNNGSPSLIND